MLTMHLKIVSKQLVGIFRRSVLSVVLEVVGQTIIEEYWPLWMKKKHINQAKPTH